MVMLEEVVTLSSLSDKGLGEPRGPSPVCGQGKPRERTLPSERDPQLLKVTPAKPGSLGTKSPFQPEPHLQCSQSLQCHFLWPGWWGKMQKSTFRTHHPT